ncbi:MAG: transcriptional regulator [Pseudomonadota bacterium]
MNIHEFFSQYPIFTHEEFNHYSRAEGSSKSHTQNEILAYHLKKHHIIRIRRGLFASIPLAYKKFADAFPVDPYLIAGRISEDAVLAYHTAFDFHGISYSIYHQFTFLSQQKIRAFKFHQANFLCLPFPKKLYEEDQLNYDVQTVDRQGLNIKVTGLERSIVDALDRPDYSGGWEEIWRSTEYIPILNLDKIIEYAFLLDNSTTIAKVGFFLEQHKEQFKVDEHALIMLEEKKPNNIHYLERLKREPGKLIKRWNLIVPNSILKRTWEEPNNDIF